MTTSRSESDAALRTVEEQRERVRGLEEQVATIADEAFGPFPVQSPEENLIAIERGIFEQRRRIVELEQALEAIHDRAHDLSTGPAVPDGYWEIRSMAGDALRDTATLTPRADAATTTEPKE